MVMCEFCMRDCVSVCPSMCMFMNRSLVVVMVVVVGHCVVAWVCFLTEPLSHLSPSRLTSTMSGVVLYVS